MSLPPKSHEFLSHPLRLLIIVGSVFLLAFFVWSSAEARKNTRNRIVDWLPKDTRELDVFYKRYHQHFSEGDYLMVSWKGCNIDDTRLDTLAEKLTALLDDGSPPHFSRAMTTRSVIDDLTADVPQLSKEGVKSRLAGWLIGHDQHTACLVLVPPHHGLLHPSAAVQFLVSTVEQITGLERSDIYVAGTSIDSVAIDEISAESQRKLLPSFLLFSAFLLLCCLRHYFAAFLVFWAAIINEELAGTLLYWCGAHVDSISMLNSSLVYVLTISGSVHLLNYYRKTLAEMQPGEENDAPRLTFRKAILPCSLAAFTTILGMGSLGVSKMVPIQTFGIYASLTLFLGTIWFFLYILSSLQVRPIRAWFPRNLTKPPPENSILANFWERFGLVIFHCRYPITILTFLSILFFAFGIKELHTSVTFHGLLPKKAKVLQDYRFLETHIGGLIPIEVVIHFPKEEGENKKILDQLWFLESLVKELQQTDNVDAVVSVLNFLPKLPSPTSGVLREVRDRAALEGILSRGQEKLRGLKFFDPVENAGADSGNYWRISLRVSTQKKLDYAVLIADVEKHLETVRQRNHEIDNVRMDVTGGIPLVFRAQELLLWDLIYSFMTAFGLIALTMMVVLRGFVRGLLAMVPNVFPCVIVFGLLGLCRIPVDMGSMMTASVALGISVDSTLHLLTWMSIAMRRGLTRKDAVLYAVQRCSTALTQTMVICGIGMLIFGLSDFVPVARFAILLCAILIISLLGAIVALPAILFSPLGRFFEISDKEKEMKWIL
ncbi:MAG: MMPL family transporter [Planctomycetaceae bacterium]|jgi:predicted RND superfamily exporter protein|nr:MMPL family transporter [Planctomycetaceae bacterium]